MKNKEKKKILVINTIELQSKMKEKVVLEKAIPFEVYQDNANLLKSFELQIEESILNDKNTPIKEIAAKLNISQSTLERVIKKKLNMSPNKYISKRKLEKADILLRSNMGMSIKEISFSLGFNSVSYFIKCYKKMYHRTPSQI